MSVAYSAPKDFNKIQNRRPISVNKSKNFYVNVPNRSADILAKRRNPPSQTLEKLKGNAWARVPVKGLEGPLKNEMENFNPFTDS